MKLENGGHNPKDTKNGRAVREVRHPLAVPDGPCVAWCCCLRPCVEPRKGEPLMANVRRQTVCEINKRHHLDQWGRCLGFRCTYGWPLGQRSLGGR